MCKQAFAPCRWRRKTQSYHHANISTTRSAIVNKASMNLRSILIQFLWGKIGQGADQAASQDILPVYAPIPHSIILVLLYRLEALICRPYPATQAPAGRKAITNVFTGAAPASVQSLSQRATASKTHNSILQEKSPSTMTTSRGATFSQTASNTALAWPARNETEG